MEATDVGSATIKVSPQALSDAAQTIETLVGEVVGHLNTITTTLDGLHLSWTGGAADVQADFSNRWTAQMTLLFGKSSGTGKSTAAAPSSAPVTMDDGVLTMFVAGLLAAVGNYDSAEENIIKGLMPFTSLGIGVGGGASGHSSAKSAIIETSS